MHQVGFVGMFMTGEKADHLYSYLSVEQRRHYRVTIDKESGRLRWEHPSPHVVKHTGEQHPLVETVC